MNYIKIQSCWFTGLSGLQKFVGTNSSRPKWIGQYLWAKVSSLNYPGSTSIHSVGYIIKTGGSNPTRS